MKDNFLLKEDALSLKELGFDEPCIAFFKDDSLKAVSQHWGSSVTGICKKLGYRVDDLILAPTFRDVFSFFKREYGIQGFVDYDYNDRFYYSFKWVRSNGDFGTISSEDWESSERAELEGLRVIIKLLKIEKDGPRR